VELFLASLVGSSFESLEKDFDDGARHSSQSYLHQFLNVETTRSQRASEFALVTKLLFALLLAAIL